MCGEAVSPPACPCLLSLVQPSLSVLRTFGVPALSWGTDLAGRRERNPNLSQWPPQLPWPAQCWRSGVGPAQAVCLKSSCVGDANSQVKRVSKEKVALYLDFDSGEEFRSAWQEGCVGQQEHVLYYGKSFRGSRTCS